MDAQPNTDKGFETPAAAGQGLAAAARGRVRIDGASDAHKASAPPAAAGMTAATEADLGPAIARTCAAHLDMVAAALRGIGRAGAAERIAEIALEILPADDLAAAAAVLDADLAAHGQAGGLA